MESRKEKSREDVRTEIKSGCEKKQDVDLTIDEIDTAKLISEGRKATDEEVKAAVNQINPDEGSMNSRG